jgi:hypothetical protein
MHKILFFLYHPHKFSNEPKDRSCIEMPNQSDSTCRCKFTGFNVLKKATDSFYVVIYLLKKDENQSLLNRKKKELRKFQTYDLLHINYKTWKIDWFLLCLSN